MAFGTIEQERGSSPLADPICDLGYLENSVYFSINMYQLFAGLQQLDEVPQILHSSMKVITGGRTFGAPPVC